MIPPLEAVGLWLVKRSCRCPVNASAHVVKASSDDPGERMVREFADKIRPIIGRQVDAVVARLRSSGLSGYQLATQAAIEMADPKFGAAVVEVARPMIVEAIGAGAAAGFRQIAMDPFDVFNPAVQRWVDGATTRLAEDVAMGTTTRVADLIGSSLERGETIDQIASVLEGSGFDEVRAERIARSETARAYTQGTIESWDQSGVVEGKQWVLSDEACEFCRGAAALYEGRTVGLRDTFFPEGAVLGGTDGGRMVLDYSAVDGPPLHPGCRCALRAVLKR